MHPLIWISSIMRTLKFISHIPALMFSLTCHWMSEYALVWFTERSKKRDILDAFLPTVSIVNEGIHWYNYYTRTGLILKCLSPSPSPPPHVEWGSLLPEEATWWETMGTQNLFRRSQSPASTFKHNFTQMVQTTRNQKGKGGISLPFFDRVRILFLF